MGQIPHIKEPLPSNLGELSDTAWADALGLHGNDRDQVLKRLEQVRALKGATAPVKQPVPAQPPTKAPEARQDQRREPEQHQPHRDSQGPHFEHGKPTGR